MKKCVGAIWIGAVCLAVGQHGAGAQEGTGLYVRGDLGASLIPQTDVEEFFGPVAGTEVRFDPGLRFGAAVGYQLTPWLAAEFETGFAYNTVDSVTGQGSVDASLLQVPFLANLVVQCNHFGAFVPFIGGGAGGVSSMLSIDDSFGVGGGTVHLDGSETDFEFAYQGFAGFRYEFNERMGVGLMYRFLGSTGPKWDVEDAFGFYPTTRIALNDVFTHSVSATFHMKF